MAEFVIAPEDPRRPDAAHLVFELDCMFEMLYPAESNHLLDIETLAKPDIRFFVVRRNGNGEALGCGALWIKESFGEVKGIYVKPTARGLKLGHLILERLEEEARRCKLTVVKLETGIHQPEALGLFAAAGFSKCAAFGDYPADDPNSVFMEKRIV
jgi:putative acetyltransferase